MDDRAWLDDVVRRSLEELGQSVVRRAGSPSPAAPLSPRGGAAPPTGSAADAGAGRPRPVQERKLSQAAEQVFLRLALFPTETIEERQRFLYLDRNEEGRARKELLRWGLIESEGALLKREFFGLTTLGRDLARERGLQLPVMNGRVRHAVLMKGMADGVGSLPGVRVERERRLGERQADLVAYLPGGGLVVLQASVENEAPYEAAALVELAGLPGVTRAVLVAVTRQKADLIGARAGELVAAAGPEATALLGRIRLRDARTVLREGFDWAALIGYELPGDPDRDGRGRDGGGTGQAEEEQGGGGQP